MKNLALITGVMLLVFNTLIGLIVSTYSEFNFLMVDISIVISTTLVYVISSTRLDDGYKIGLSWLFIFTGLIRIACCIALPNYAKNNIVLFLIVGVTLFELLCISVCYIISNKVDDNYS